MIKGIQLTLIIGPVVLPMTAPAGVTNALESVQVNVDRERTGFQLVFKVGKHSSIQRELIPAGYFDPIVTRVIIMVTMRSLPEVLCDGLITNQELSPSNEPGQSTLTVTGEDLSLLMDLVDLDFVRYPNLPDIGIVNAALAKYMALSIYPVVIPPIFNNIPILTERVPTQSGTDLDYIGGLAQKHGYVFYVEAGPLPTQNIAYWGPDIRIPHPQPALNINMDAHTNVESLSVSLDGMKKKILVLYMMDPVTKKIPSPVPVPNVNLFRPPLGARPTPPSKVEFMTKTSKLEPLEVLGKALGELINSADAINVSGSLDVLRYGRVLKARRLVGVRGAGIAYDGMYYVNSVTHELSRGSYKQNFTLSRDGMISNTPRVFS